MASEALKANASLKVIRLNASLRVNAIPPEGAKALEEVHEQMPMQM